MMNKETLPHSKWLENVFKANCSKKQEEVAIFISPKIIFQSKLIRWGRILYTHRRKNPTLKPLNNEHL